MPVVSRGPDLHSGSTVIDFGPVSAHTTDASVHVVAPGVTDDSRVQAWFQADPTVPDGTEDEHVMIAAMVDLVTSRCRDNAFTIHGIVREGTQSGSFVVQYRWR